jgi:hypothetical protein
MTRIAYGSTKPLIGGFVGINVLPGTFSLRMKIEQSACGLILIGVVVIVDGKDPRSLSAATRLTAGPGSLPDR